jgi:hypothetical protein
VTVPASTREQRVYRGDDVAAALGKTMQAIKDRIERRTLPGWSARDPGNSLRLWLVDADWADAHDPTIDAAGLASGHWPLPVLEQSAPLRPSADPLDSLAVQLELARAETAVERHERMRVQLEAKDQQVTQAQREVKRLKGLLLASQQALSASHAAQTAAAQAVDSMLGSSISGPDDQEEPSAS